MSQIRPLPLNIGSVSCQCVCVDYISLPDAKGTESVRRGQIESLYAEAMLLASEARGCFAFERGAVGEQNEQNEQNEQDTDTRIAFVCESLKTTTRLVHVIAWLLNQRALLAGEIPAASASAPAMEASQGAAEDFPKQVLPPDEKVCDTFDPVARRIIFRSQRLFERVKILAERWDTPPSEPPVKRIIAELQSHF